MEGNYEQGLIASLGMKIIEMKKGKVVMTMPVDDRTRQPMGFLHGGASVALAETAASLGTAQLIDPETQICFGLEINANHIRSKTEGMVTARAEAVHIGRSTCVWEIRIVDENDRLICLSRCTVAIVNKR
ncbi:MULTISPECIES: hotdog fold thioesterase [Bacillus]|jgi:1,4-dihydroxy-2-naphthoyl-CoA hydrolase|uniref:Thioesterase domain-containing protein n=1 Tax=Bacillus smithii 7_3_47FAA TaxID=665952 RepID=G9QLR9_9BACI|nr:hotdog fold thioesterase [Bacillus smithii]EHL77937.1 hypothetical protein HMPREF1015_03162 [Bacillus smithii 7_3_47FAA]MED1419849.1 hotdog fold thioesterase [Bacillus smithii]MED1455410.1 hotdog fold thioesterase [Bacillus smithii]